MKTRRAMRAALFVSLALAGCGPGEDAGSSAPPAPPLRVAFKLDATLTGGLYLGDRWVAPETFHAPAQTGPTFTVEARVAAAAGAAVAWSPSDRGAIVVVPGDGHQVAITVLRPGVSTLTVTAAGSSAALAIEADRVDGTWLVTFRQ